MFTLYLLSTIFLLCKHHGQYGCNAAASLEIDVLLAVQCLLCISVSVSFVNQLKSLWINLSEFYLYIIMMTSSVRTANNVVNNAVKFLRDTTELFENDSIEDDVPATSHRHHRATNGSPFSSMPPNQSLPSHTWKKYSSGLGKLTRSEYLSNAHFIALTRILTWT